MDVSLVNFRREGGASLVIITAPHEEVHDTVHGREELLVMRGGRAAALREARASEVSAHQVAPAPLEGRVGV